MRRRVLLCATTTGYQTRMFDEAAAALDVELILATDRCDHLDDPWRDRAIPVRFHEEAASTAAVVRAVDGHVDGVLAVGDRPTRLAARVGETLGRPWHSVEGAAASRDKRLFRERLAAAGLRAPAYRVVRPEAWRTALAAIPFPCVVKPLVLSGSRGVIRANDERELDAAVARVARLLAAPDVRALRDPAAGDLLIEAFVPGHEVAVEGVLDRGVLQVLAVFDKPDPLDGPFFEETVYLTPTVRATSSQLNVVAEVARAARAARLWHGPIHAECRVDGDAITVLEIAARPIGGRCARALRFDGPDASGESLEGVLLRHARGDDVTLWAREARASGVMMVPIPRSGVLRGVDGVGEASAVPWVTEVSITAKVDQYLEALPEGASYLGFIFAAGPDAGTVDAALRHAHACLRCSFDTRIDVRPAP